MFKIYDGREAFYQWDLDRKLIVEDKSITQVHFCNRTGSCSLLRNVYEVNGMYLVDVPNLLLQDNWDIKVYGFDSNYTKHSASYNVIQRTRPENYVYTEEEQYRWEQLEERIDEIEEKGVSDETVSNAINSYLEENPIEVPVESVNGKTGAVVLSAADVGALPDTTIIPDTTGLATKEYVDSEIAKINVSGGGGSADVDLSDYYTKSEVDGLIPDTTGFATTKYVDDAIAGIGGGGSTDLSDYYTKTEIEALGYQTEAQVLALITANMPASGEEVGY